MSALSNVWPLFWPYFKIRMRFTAIETITDGLPIIDEIVGVKYTQYAAMISNVLVFEGLIGKPCIIRCKEIVNGEGLAVRATVTAPLLLLLAVLILWTTIVTVFQPIFALPILIFLVAYILGPLSGATNSLLYLLLTNQEST